MTRIEQEKRIVRKMIDAAEFLENPFKFETIWRRSTLLDSVDVHWTS